MVLPYLKGLLYILCYYCVDIFGYYLVKDFYLVCEYITNGIKALSLAKWQNFSILGKILRKKGGQ